MEGGGWRSEALPAPARPLRSARTFAPSASSVTCLIEGFGENALFQRDAGI